MASAPADRSAGLTRPTTTRLANTSNPVDTQADDLSAGAFAQPDHRGVVEPQRPLDEGREIFAVSGVVQPDTALG